MVPSSRVAAAPFIVAATFAFSAQAPLQRRQKSFGGSPSSCDIHVYDNAFHPSACEGIHHLAIDHSIRGNDGSSIFFRPPYNESVLSPLESVIHSALSALNDTTTTVEYWSREEYMNLDVHADVDEVELEDEGTLRCPKMAHVLYLKVEDSVRGPTCVFPTKRIGWGFENVAEKVDLVTVPARQGRILRFPGSAMHAVPRPADRWLLTAEEERSLRLKEEAHDQEFDDEEHDEDEDIDVDEKDLDAERSVLLFNTWSDDSPPPRGINRDYATGALPDGIELDEEVGFAKSQEARHITEWEQNYGVDAEQICCNPIMDWRETVIVGVGGDTSATGAERDAEEKFDITPSRQVVRVNLMGKQTRRLHPEKSILLRFGPVEKLRAALEESMKVTYFRLCADEAKQYGRLNKS